MRSVLITRPQPAADEFADRLRREGFSPYVAPLLAYEEVAATIPRLEHFQALVFTSTEGARYFSAREKDRLLPVFAVGETTAAAATRAGFEKVFFAAGDGEDLAALILAHRESLHLKQVLHVAGEDVAADLGKLLSSAPIAVQRVTLYKANVIDRLPPDVERALLQGKISHVTLLSARAAAQLSSLLQGKDHAAVLPEMSVVCLSARIAAEIKGLPWKAVQIAKTPKLEALVDILRGHDDNGATPPRFLPAAGVVEAFGGLRPLANDLGITASTVQGWKKRGLIPAARHADVARAAKNKGIDIDHLWQEEGAMTEEKKIEKVYIDRRKASDRRQKHASPDEKGVVRAEGYAGPDRRTGLDRRAYHERQAQRVRALKWSFLNRTVLSFAFLFIAIIGMALFLLAPEYIRLEKEAARAAQLAYELQRTSQRVTELEKPKPAPAPSMGAVLSTQISKFNTGVTDIQESTQEVAKEAVASVVPAAKVTGITALMRVLSELRRLQSTPEGDAAVGAGMEKLKAALAGTSNNPEEIRQAVDAARKADPALEAVLKDVDNKDLSAAAMMLLLSEFRRNVATERSFSSDVLLLQKLFNDDPAMLQSLKNLSPYAERGVLSRDTLQSEFKGLATDIVMAKLAGEDLSVQEKAMKRMERFVKMRKISDVEGDSVDAIVARAQLMLERNDVKGAMAELQKLDGPPAETAAPWLAQAQGRVAADDSSDFLMKAVVGKLTPDGSPQGAVDNIMSTIKGVLTPGHDAAPYVSPALRGSGSPGFGQ